MNPILNIVQAQKQGHPFGIYSCCSANEYVLKAALLRGRQRRTPVLIEATANQVNQFGGYTGMRPADFYDYVQKLIRDSGIAPELVILGGDHLGPLTWTELPEHDAMENARELVRQFVLAGFTKIHLDTSMRVADDSRTERLSDETIARRGAELCAVCEDAFRDRQKQLPDAVKPVYIIGSEVPIPGGAQTAEDSVGVTKPEDCLATYESFRRAFSAQHLDDAWSRVAGLVVQPGVEFGDAEVFAYDSAKASGLTAVLNKLPLVFEGHSTDYQTPDCLRAMVKDGIAILKVGPALTFAMREGLFALENIEKELLTGTGTPLSDFRATLEYQMLESDGNWKKHYHGTGNEQKLARAFSFSDRARYYLPQKAVAASAARLIENLRSVPIPLSLISQYMPMQYTAVRAGKVACDPEALVLDRIGNCIDEYLYATTEGGNTYAIRT
jgi:D-tagatose-1,6-bisphosphate aldolase subunit GatZ/KbaZ